MDFEYSPKVQELRKRLIAFMEEHIYPNDHKWWDHVKGDKRWEPVPIIEELGIPTEQRYIDAYCRRTGREGVSRSDWDFYMAYNLFRIAAILQGIAKRVVDGTAASEHARDAGGRAPLMAELGWKQVEKILERS